MIKQTNANLWYTFEAASHCLSWLAWHKGSPETALRNHDSSKLREHKTRHHLHLDNWLRPPSYSILPSNLVPLPTLVHFQISLIPFIGHLYHGPFSLNEITFQYSKQDEEVIESYNWCREFLFGLPVMCLMSAQIENLSLAAIIAPSFLSISFPIGRKHQLLHLKY